jgi:hypothetical protein
MVNLYGHAARNGGYSQGDTYGGSRTSPTRNEGNEKKLMRFFFVLSVAPF